MNKPTKIITHHALSSTQSTAQDIDAWHKLRWAGFVSRYFKNRNGEPYHVGYHYVIEWKGNVVQCRDESEEGAHTIGMNNSSIGVCFVGNFDNHMPSEAQLSSWRTLYKEIVSRHPHLKPSDVVPHRRYANKSCHGKLLSDDYFSSLVANSPEELASLQKRVLELQVILARLKALLSKKQR